jgi:hypothetical protein
MWLGITYPALVSVWLGIHITWVCHLDTSYYFHRVSTSNGYVMLIARITFIGYQTSNGCQFDQISIALGYVMSIPHITLIGYQCDRLSTSLGYQCWHVPLSPGITHVAVTFAGYQYYLGMSCWYLILLLSAINVTGYHMPCTTFSVTGYRYHLGMSSRYLVLLFIGY